MGYLYAIKLHQNKYQVDLYIGFSNVHTPECKFQIHMNYGGQCLCTPGRGNVEPEQSAYMVREYGYELLDSKILEGRIGRDDREMYALQFACQGYRVWCGNKKISL